MNNKSLTLYDITAEEQRVISALIENEGELTDELVDALDALKENKICKVENYHRLYVHLEAIANAAKAEEDRLAKKRRVAERGMQRLKDGLLFNMEALGITRIEGESVEARLRANPGRMVFDEGAVLKPCLPYIEKVREYLPDWVTLDVKVSKTKLKEAYQTGGVPLDESVRMEMSNTIVFR